MAVVGDVVADDVGDRSHHAAVHDGVAVRVGGADSDRRRPGQTLITFLFDRGEFFDFRSFTKFQAFS